MPSGPDGSVSVVRAGAAGSVDVALSGGELVWACSSCGHPLGPVTANFKLAAAQRELSPPAVDPWLYPDPAQFGDDEIVLRQTCCPACAALLAQEFCKRGDEPWHYFQLDPEGLADG